MKAATSPEAFEILEDSTKARELDKIFSELKSEKTKDNKKQITIGNTEYNVRIARNKKVLHSQLK